MNAPSGVSPWTLRILKRQDDGCWRRAEQPRFE
ncbi:hypothetical protein HY30_08050 [Hyphomonas chukchiensis]|uniref:Uncharacterized protein n=1 Tax=Hyphomonas chukchiensis TaxID=1280947 RepID=A0A062UET5_9PROT|nr:hypothetical protein HY30_08050 [Hyphomonas chukchiensis]